MVMTATVGVRHEEFKLNSRGEEETFRDIIIRIETYFSESDFDAVLSSLKEILRKAGVYYPDIRVEEKGSNPTPQSKTIRKN